VLIQRPIEVCFFGSIREIKELGIYTKIFKPKLERLYLLSFKNEKNEIFLIQIDLTARNSYKVVKVKLDAIFFEIDCHDPDVFYFIEENIIYTMNFNVKESSFGGIFGGNQKEEKNLFGAKEFFRSKYELEFIRFDENMDNFFINEGKMIKMLSYNTFDVKKIFDHQIFSPIDVFFSTDFKFLFRYCFYFLKFNLKVFI
jgi:hypothetical protein